jgi:AcrR family transcriptional regulator
MSSQAERRAATGAAILASARTLFASRGFDAASIDDIAEGARVAKGAVYHHFESKEAIFTTVLDGVQREIQQAQVPAGLRIEGDLADRMAAGVQHYLLTASAPAHRRILLIDGPAVIGWRRWREIDDQYFGAGARQAVAALLGESASPAEIDALTHLIMGAVMEAAMVCATAADVETAARDLTGALRRALKGLQPHAPQADVGHDAL